MGIRVGMWRIRVGIMGIRVGMREIRMGMRQIRVECGECGELGVDMKAMRMRFFVQEWN